MRPVLVYVLAATLPALSVLAQRHHGGGGGSDLPSTFITIASAAPAATSGTGFSSTASSPDAASSANSSSAGVSSSASSGSVDTSLIPPFGITAGVKATDGTANCVGDGGKDIP